MSVSKVSLSIDEEVLGLVPIGENPVTSLWEFYHLRSAWDGTSDPATIAITSPLATSTAHTALTGACASCGLHADTTPGADSRSQRISPVFWSTPTIRPPSVGATTTPPEIAGVAQMPRGSATDQTIGSSGLRGSSLTSWPTSVLRADDAIIASGPDEGRSSLAERLGWQLVVDEESSEVALVPQDDRVA